MIIQYMLPVQINGPKNIKKFPRYNGCRTIEQIPCLFSEVANCCFVFLPDVPAGTYAIV